MTQTPSVYTAHDIPDLLNTLPTLFGFWPQESLVAVATRGPRRRFGFRMRVDIPARESVQDLAGIVVGHLANQGAEGAILIAVTQQQEIARDLLAAIERQLPPITVIVAARADGERYWSDEPGFPTEGIAYETSDHHLAVVQAIAAGQQILPDRQALVDRFAAVQDPRRAWMERAADEVLREVVALIARTPDGDLTPAAMQQVQPILDRGLAGERLTDDELVRFSIWMSSIAVRDEVWYQITAETADAMLAFLALVSRSVVPPFEAAVLSLTAFAAWLTGDGAQSLIAVERALETDETYSMARLILQMLEGGVSPAHWLALQAAKPVSP
ncbi:hypothetical protein ASC61_15690 [Aeromicrobium sp. Root344]|uniref:DUF4192 domain-containing protein n=1 Tax=Aeromicrobium sp. Root344 TaxID=1736521 RepID=UPI0006F305C5|nr:DUF4192 domain-containing protein [Aeromicrobium sp. Root344]KQV76327.1 hypothetical protein ASC61_15690 [Aeromicrobium sp. Root344]